MTASITPLEPPPSNDKMSKPGFLLRYWELGSRLAEAQMVGLIQSKEV